MFSYYNLTQKNQRAEIINYTSKKINYYPPIP